MPFVQLFWPHEVCVGVAAHENGVCAPPRRLWAHLAAPRVPLHLHALLATVSGQMQSAVRVRLGGRRLEAGGHRVVDGTNIEVVENFNFLGIIINKQLNWNSRIEYISGKISITIGVLNRIKHQVPLEVLVTVYNTLLLSHINYGILLWGHISKRIHKLQKKALRIITLSKYNAHTEPLFKQLNLLKVFDIHKLNKLKFYFKFINNELPQYFQELPLNANRDIHEYRTRQKHNVHMIRVNHVYAKYNIRYDLPVFINNTHASITDKINTHSLQGFSRYVKTKYVESYKMNCTIPDCYICQNM